MNDKEKEKIYREIRGTGRYFQSIFVVPTKDGAVKSILYTPDKDADGNLIPLTEQSFYQGLQQSERDDLLGIADEQQIPHGVMYGMSKVWDKFKGGNKGSSAYNITLTGQVEETAAPEVSKEQATVRPKAVQLPSGEFNLSAPVFSQPTNNINMTGPLISEEGGLGKQDTSTQVSPRLFVSQKNLETYAPVGTSSEVVKKGNPEPTNIEAADATLIPCVAAFLLADTFRTDDPSNTMHWSDDELRSGFVDYMNKNGYRPTQEMADYFVQQVRSYDTSALFPPSIELADGALDTDEVRDYNSRLAIGNAPVHRNWYELRGKDIYDVHNAEMFTDTPELARAIEFYQQPNKMLNTPLKKAEEENFQLWLEDAVKKGIIHSNDDSYDYDYRGYWKAYVQGNKAPQELKPGMHFTDEFKKPNHPTFSKGSKYATGEFSPYAGTWEGDTYIPGKLLYPRENQAAHIQYIKDTSITYEEAVYNVGISSAKKIQRTYVQDPAIDGVVTGFGASVKPTLEKEKLHTVTEEEHRNFEAVPGLKGKTSPGITVMNKESAAQATKAGHAARIAKVARANVHVIIRDYRSFENSQPFNGAPDVANAEVLNWLIEYKQGNPDGFAREFFPEEYTKYADSSALVLAQLRTVQVQVEQARAKGDQTVLEPLLATQAALETAYKQAEVKRLYILQALTGTLPGAFASTIPAETLHKLQETNRLDTSTYNLVSNYVQGSLALASVFTEQLQHKVFIESTTVSKKDGKTKNHYKISEDDKTFEGEYGDARAWAVTMPGIIGADAGKLSLYTTVVNGDAEKRISAIPSIEFRTNLARVRAKLNFLSGRTVALYGQELSTFSSTEIDNLAKMFTLLGYSEAIGDKQSRYVFDESLVVDEIAKLKNTMYLSDKYNVIIDRNLASTYGIVNTDMLDTVLLHATAEAKEAVRDGRVVRDIGGGPDAEAQNASFREEGALQPFIMGGRIYFMTSYKGGDSRGVVYERVSGVPYSISLEDLINSRRYDAQFYTDYTKKTGAKLTPRPYVEELANPDRQIFPGYVSKNLRGRTAWVVESLAGHLGDNVDVTRQQADKEYHEILTTVQRTIKTLEFTRETDNITIEKIFLEHLKKAGFKAGGATYKSLYDVPAVIDAAMKTVQNFVPIEMPKLDMFKTVERL